ASTASAAKARIRPALPLARVVPLPRTEPVRSCPGAGGNAGRLQRGPSEQRGELCAQALRRHGLGKIAETGVLDHAQALRCGIAGDDHRRYAYTEFVLDSAHRIDAV